MQKILGRLRRAVTDYDMIADGDRICVGLSGGKDSGVLLTALAMYRRFSPQKFDLVGINIDMGFADTKAEEVAALAAHCESLDVPFVSVKTDIAEILFEARKETNPCSLCSKMRRGALVTAARERGCTKLALGHHSNDLLETMLLSFIYEGRLSTFMPVSFMDRSEMTVIRPLLYVEEGDIRGAQRRLGIPVVFNPCPMDKHTQREYMKKLVDDISATIPYARDRMTSAVLSPDRYNLLDKSLGYKKKD